jgi:hypothetical protein
MLDAGSKRYGGGQTLISPVNSIFWFRSPTILPCAGWLQDAIPHPHKHAHSCKVTWETVWAGASIAFTPPAPNAIPSRCWRCASTVCEGGTSVHDYGGGKADDIADKACCSNIVWATQVAIEHVSEDIIDIE